MREKHKIIFLSIPIQEEKNTHNPEHTPFNSSMNYNC